MGDCIWRPDVVVSRATADEPEMISDVSFSLCVTPPASLPSPPTPHSCVSFRPLTSSPVRARRREPLSQATHATFTEHGGADGIQAHIERLIAEPVALGEPDVLGLAAFASDSANDITSRAVSRLAAREARAATLLSHKIMTPRWKPPRRDAARGPRASSPRRRDDTPHGSFPRPAPLATEPEPPATAFASGSEFSGKEAALVITSIADRVGRRRTARSTGPIAAQTAHSTGSAPSGHTRRNRPTQLCAAELGSERPPPAVSPPPPPPVPVPAPPLAGRNFAAGLVGGGPARRATSRRLPASAAPPPASAASSRVLRARPSRPNRNLEDDLEDDLEPEPEPEPKRRRKATKTTTKSRKGGRSPVAGITAKVTDDELEALKTSDPAKYRRIVGNRKSAAASKARREAAAEETAAALRDVQRENMALLAKLARAEAALRLREDRAGR